MTKRSIIIISTILIVLIGGYHLGNYAINRLLLGKVEDVLKNDNLEKEIDKLLNPDELDENLAELLPQEKPGEKAPSKPKVQHDEKTDTHPGVDDTDQETPREEPPEEIAKPEPEPDRLEFKTKNDAIEFVRDRFSAKEVKELYKIYNEIQTEGLTSEVRSQLKAEALKKFTPEEIEAVKKIILGGN